MGTLLVEPFSRLVLALARKSVQEMQETLQAYRMLWSSLPSLLKSNGGALKQRELSSEAVRSIPAG